MRVPLSWIREFTPVEAPPAEIADALNQLGLEVEEIDEPGREINGVVVAKILDVVPHPDADRIRLADVDFGDGQLRVVCGAPNIYPGMVAPFARVGAVLPGDFKIERRKIRGVVSEGMLVLRARARPGRRPLRHPRAAGRRRRSARTCARCSVSTTSCSTCRSRRTGPTRWVSPVSPVRSRRYFGLPFTVSEAEPDAIVDAIGDSRVIVEAPDRCPRFVATTATVSIGPSPDWMQQRLRLAGMRPISNVVDVTNYVMLERCRPLARLRPRPSRRARHRGAARRGGRADS